MLLLQEVLQRQIIQKIAIPRLLFEAERANVEVLVLKRVVELGQIIGELQDVLHRLQV